MSKIKINPNKMKGKEKVQRRGKREGKVEDKLKGMILNSDIKRRDQDMVWDFSSRLFFRLPKDLVLSEILTRLPVKTLGRFRSVNKEWNSIISDHQFARSQFHRSQLNPNTPSYFLLCQPRFNFQILSYDPNDNETPTALYPIHDFRILKGEDQSQAAGLIGSCNGLVCHGLCLSLFSIYNPITLKCHYFRHVFPLVECDKVFGFGYSDTLDDYMVVVFELSASKRLLVYSLASNWWRKIDALDQNISPNLMSGYKGVLVDETLHWPMTREGDDRYIGAFNLVKETFEVFPVSKEIWSCSIGSNCAFNLSVLDGCLCICSTRDQKAEIWILNIYGDWSSWKKLLILEIPKAYSCRNIFGCSMAGRVFMHTQDDSLLLVDLRRRRVKYKVLVMRLNDYVVPSYVESLVVPLTKSPYIRKSYHQIEHMRRYDHVIDPRLSMKCQCLD